MRAGLAATAVGLSGCLAAPPGSTATPSEDAGGEPDAAPGAIPACAQPTLVTDDFGDMVALPGFAVARSGTATVTMDGSAAVFDLGSSGSATLASYRAFSLDEAATFVEVVTPPDDDGEAGFSFVAAHDEGNSVAFKIQGGKLVAQYQLDAADPQPVKTISFDPVNHRWLRLREEGETMYWESSPDGGAYTPFAEAPSVVPLTYVRIQFYGTSDPSGVAGGPVTVDNFNGGGPPIGSWCKAASFAADFEDPVATEVWAEALDPGCAVSHLGGELLFELAAGMDGSCHRVARPRFDLTGSSAGVEIVEPIDASEDAIASLRLYADPGNWLEMRVGAGSSRWSRSAPAPARRRGWMTSRQRLTGAGASARTAESSTSRPTTAPRGSRGTRWTIPSTSRRSSCGCRCWC